MTKIYEFVDAGWWSSIGCSCCEDTWMETWDCDLLEYSEYTIDGCYVAAIAHATQMPYDEQEKLDWLSSEELEELAKVLNVKVVFVE